MKKGDKVVTSKGTGFVISIGEWTIRVDLDGHGPTEMTVDEVLNTVD